MCGPKSAKSCELCWKNGSRSWIDFRMIPITIRALRFFVVDFLGRYNEQKRKETSGLYVIGHSHLRIVHGAHSGQCPGSRGKAKIDQSGSESDRHYPRKTC